MQRMNPTDGHNLPYWWSTLLGLFSVLSLQDYVFILGALVSAYFTIKTYYAKRKEERERLEEEKKRWIGPYISIHFLSLNPLLVRRRRYSRGERYPSALCGCHSL